MITVIYRSTAHSNLAQIGQLARSRARTQLITTTTTAHRVKSNTAEGRRYTSFLLTLPPPSPPPQPLSAFHVRHVPLSSTERRRRRISEYKVCVYGTTVPFGSNSISHIKKEKSRNCAGSIIHSDHRDICLHCAYKSRSIAKKGSAEQR